MDYYRDTYGKETTRHPRQCVFIGTSNSASVINDVTGARRFLPLELHSKGTDIFHHEAEIREEIKQCYAEMVYAYMRETEMNYPTVAPAVAKEVESRQSNATVDDWRIGVIEEYLKGKSAVCICQIKREALARIGGGTVPTTAESREIADVLISKLGCTRGGVKRFGEYGKQKSFIVPASLATSMTGTATTTIESKHSMAKSA